MAESLQGARFVEHNIICKMKNHFLIGMLLPGLGWTSNI